MKRLTIPGSGTESRATKPARVSAPATLGGAAFGASREDTGADLLEAAQAAEIEQQATLEAAPVEQSYPETLALYVRYYLTVRTPVPEAHQDAAKAQGKVRFEQFDGVAEALGGRRRRRIRTRRGIRCADVGGDRHLGSSRSSRPTEHGPLLTKGGDELA